MTPLDEIAAERRRYRAEEIYGHWSVLAELPCINGLSAWVQIADCGEPDPSDEMCGFDPAEWARKIADALESLDRAAEREGQR